MVLALGGGRARLKRSSDSIRGLRWAMRTTPVTFPKAGTASQTTCQNALSGQRRRLLANIIPPKKTMTGSHFSHYPIFPIFSHFFPFQIPSAMTKW